jgi:SOS-response transcriptional repressor LexA
MAFAKSTDHLDGDERPFSDFVLPRPHASAVYRVKDDRLAEAAIVAGDVVVIERDQPLRGGRIALVRVGGATRLVRVVRSGGSFAFRDMPDQDEAVEVIGIASRVVRALIP